MFILVGLAVLAACFLWWRRGLDFPGPPAWPVLGNMLQLDLPRMHLILTEWGKKYGGVYKLRMFGEELVVISDAKTFQECLVTKGKDFSGRPVFYEFAECLGSGSGIGLSQPAPLWRHMRKLVHSNIKMYDQGLERIEQVSMNMIGELFDDLTEKNGAAFDVKDTIYKAILNMVSSFAVGRTYPADSAYFRLFGELEESFKAIGKKRPVGVVMDALLFLHHVVAPLKKEAARHTRVTSEICAFMRAEASKSEAEGYTDSLVTALTRAVSRGEISDTNMMYVISDVIAGATVTTSNTLYCYLNVLINHPHVQKRLQEEVDDVLGERRVCLQDRGGLPYHMATLHELLRYTTVGALGIFHRSVADTSIAGKHVPADTTVWCNHFGASHDGAHYPQPYAFRPERFLDDEGRLVAADHPSRRHSFPFGAGARGCLGESLARSRLFLMLASLSQRFTVAAEEGEEPVTCDPRDYKYVQVLAQPAYKVRFINRNAE